MKKAIIAFVMCIGIALLMVSCSSKRDVRFRAKSINALGYVPETIYLIEADSAYKAGDTMLTDDISNNWRFILLERVK